MSEDLQPRLPGYQAPGSWGVGRFGETWALNSRLLLGWTMMLMTKKESWVEKRLVRRVISFWTYCA